MTHSVHQRITAHFAKKRIAAQEQKMFGGILFMIHGNMCAGVSAKGELMLRLSPDEVKLSAQKKGVKPEDEKSKRMGGLLFVHPEGFETDKQLAEWLDAAFDYVTTLPPKAKKKKTE